MKLWCSINLDQSEEDFSEDDKDTASEMDAA